MQGRVQSWHAPPPFIWWQPAYPDRSNNVGHKPTSHNTEFCSVFTCWFWRKILIKLKASSFCSHDWLLASCQIIHPISFSTFIKCSLFLVVLHPTQSSRWGTTPCQSSMVSLNCVFSQGHIQKQNTFTAVKKCINCLLTSFYTIMSYTFSHKNGPVLFYRKYLLYDDMSWHSLWSLYSGCNNP